MVSELCFFSILAMALPSASTLLPAVGYPVTEKLAKNNHPLWKAQVLSALRGAHVADHVNGTVQAPEKEIPKSVTQADLVPNSEYEKWEVRDQQVLNYLLSSLSRDILLQVVPVDTARDAWVTIENVFASQSRARAISTRLALAMA
jgi:hypothetical protein